MIANNLHQILILKRSDFPRWELPRINVNKEQPVHVLMDDYLKKTISIQYRFLGESSIIDRYEWPKELANITGKSGEEHRFLYLILKERISSEDLISKEFCELKFVNYDELVEKVIFRNHKIILRNVINEFYKKLHKMKEEEKESVKENHEDYLEGIDKIL